MSISDGGNKVMMVLSCWRAASNSSVVSMAAASCLLFLLSSSSSVVVVADNEHQQQQQQQKMISFPLLPHHVVRHRRLQEGYHNPTAEGQEGMKEQQRPHRYPRRHLLDPDGDAEDGASAAEDSTSTANANSPFPADQVAGLYQGYGTHYADLWCGNPPQRQTVIVDTGSGITAFPCSNCNDCGVPEYHIDALFDESQSSSFQKLTCADCLRGSCKDDGCSMGMSYAEGSRWSAYEASDLCYVGGAHKYPVLRDDNNPDDLDPFHAPAFAFDMKFGCQTKITGLFKTQLADGIMGMDIAESAFWWQMYNQNKIAQKAFSLCFSRHDEASKEGTESGAMSMGGTDLRLHDSPMVYTTTSRSTSGFYVVHIRKVYLRQGGGGLSALSTDPSLEIRTLDVSEDKLNSGRVIVDSGTTDTYFSRQASSVFKAAFQELTGETYGHDTKQFTAEELALMPTILIQLAGDEERNQKVFDDTDGTHVPGLANDLDPDHPFDVILSIPPEHYFEFDPDVDGYVSRFYVDEGKGVVFGANSMMGHDVFFDVERFQIGWAESTCDYTQLAAPYAEGQVETIVPQEGEPETAVVEPEIAVESESHEAPESVEEPETAEEPGSVPTSPSESEVTASRPMAPPDDFGEEDNDVESGHYEYNPNSEFCSGIKCQVMVLVVAILSVAIVAARIIRRSSEPSYSVAQSGLELKSTDMATSGEFVNRYQDSQSGSFA